MFDRIRYLFGLYMDKTISAAEEKELAELALDPAYKDILLRLEQEYWEKEPLVAMEEEEAENFLSGILDGRQPVIRKLHWKQLVAAASVLLLLAAGGYFMLFNKSVNKTKTPLSQEQRFRNDVNPGKYSARLMLADGSIIILDSAATGELATQGNTSVIHQGNRLIYEERAGAKEVLYNTITTAKAEIYATELSDGTKVWLNAASSIHFPVSFNDKERRVEITGEAYFEVAKDVSRRFTVVVNGAEVEVLGTHFNINAYTNESAVRTTLLEGKVRVSGKGTVAMLKPGQQARLAAGLEVIDHVDLENVMAWRNGRFYFNNSNMEAIMREVERWYDVEVEYQDVVPHLFVARIPRNVPISELLKLLELTDRVHFKIEGRKIIVMK